MPALLARRGKSNYKVENPLPHDHECFDEDQEEYGKESEAGLERLGDIT
jgi:hypothetical protein